MNTRWGRMWLGRVSVLRFRREWVPVFGCAETGKTREQIA
jgi:hypothetical protein